MQSFDPVLETRVLKTILEGKDPSLIVNLSSDWFGLPTAREIWERIHSLKQNGKKVPRPETMATDPVLSENAQTLLKGDLPTLESDEIEGAMDQLNYYRQGRVIFAMTKRVTDLLVPSQGDIGKAKIEIERSLSALQNTDFSDDILSYGYENDRALDLYDKIMSQDLNDRFIRTGFKFIDNKQGGLGRGRLYTIGANSGGGKSTLSNQMAIQMYLGGHSPLDIFHRGVQSTTGYSVNYNSFELGREECMLRTQANITRIPHDRFQLQGLSQQERIKSDKILAQFLAHGEKTGKRMEYNCPSRDINIPQLISMIEPMSFDVVIVDYINLMATINPKEGLWWNIGEAFRLMKRFAERTRCAVVMLVQIDEETKDIKYAKSIKHHSDGVWIWEHTKELRDSGLPVEVEQTKLRNFAPCSFNLQPEFEYCAFSESFGTGATPSGTPPTSTIAPMRL